MYGRHALVCVRVRGAYQKKTKKKEPSEAIFIARNICSKVHETALLL
jgi:hypothetical protein